MQNFKEKFLHNSFFNYFRSLNMGKGFRGGKKSVVEPFITVVSAVFLFIALGLADSTAGIIPIYYYTTGLALAALLYCSCLGVGYSRRQKPSTLTLMPISYKRRTVYGFLASLVNFILTLIFIFLIYFTIYLITNLLVLIFTGEWLPWFGELISVDDYYEPPCAQGILFVLFTFVLCYGVGMIISGIRNKKLRYGIMIGFPLLMFLFMRIFMTCASAGSHIVNVPYMFERLPLSWLWLTVWALISAAVFALSVYLTVRYEKPKKY